MKSPFTGGEVILLKEPKELEIKGSKYCIIHYQYQCVDTRELYTDTKLDELNLNQVYSQSQKE